MAGDNMTAFWAQFNYYFPKLLDKALPTCTFYHHMSPNETQLINTETMKACLSAIVSTFEAASHNGCDTILLPSSILIHLSLGTTYPILSAAWTCCHRSFKYISTRFSKTQRLLKGLFQYQKNQFHRWTVSTGMSIEPHQVIPTTNPTASSQHIFGYRTQSFLRPDLLPRWQL